MATSTTDFLSVSVHSIIIFRNNNNYMECLVVSIFVYLHLYKKRRKNIRNLRTINNKKGMCKLLSVL